jgi:AcrR family transcriptional regulator
VLDALFAGVRPASAATTGSSVDTIGFIMSEATPRKPANRPSRRQDLIDAAVELFSLQPWELVTVADIVERAGMTSAAFYYHFPSREQLLEEVVEDFAKHWVGTIEAMLDDADALEAICQVPMALLDEIDRSPQIARIFFLSAATAPLLVERIHRGARRELARAATAAVQRLAPDRSEAVAMVNGLAMVCLYEMAVRAFLALDEPYRVLGPRRFRTQLGVLSDMATRDYPAVR